MNQYMGWGIKVKYILRPLIAFQLLVCFLLILVIFKNNSSQSVKIDQIKKTDITSTPSASLDFFYEPKESAEIIDGAYKGVSYTINADSLNETRDYSEAKPDNVYRIVVLGDSITYGTHVNTKENWTEVLEDQLKECSNKKYEIINLAVPGYDNAYSVERFERRGQKYHPDLVLWYQYDLYRIVEEQQRILKKFGKDFREENDYSDNLLGNQVTYDLLQYAAKEVVERIGESEILKFQRNVIESLRNYYKGELLFITFPAMKKEHRKVIEDLVKEDQRAFIFYQTTNYIKKGESLDGIHPSIGGHKIIANDVINYLLKNNIIDCN